MNDSRLGDPPAGPQTPTTFADPAISAREAARRRIEKDKWAPEALLPAEAFSDEPASQQDFARLCDADTPTGRNAHAVRRRILSSCVGWKKRPTPEEFYNAVRAERPTPRQTGIMRMWAQRQRSGTFSEAWVQHAYTLRQLVQALQAPHRHDDYSGGIWYRGYAGTAGDVTLTMLASGINTVNTWVGTNCR